MGPVKSPTPSVAVDAYEMAIPECCRLQTITAHEDIMLCWGLLDSVKKGLKHDCGWCEYNKEHTPEEWHAWWKETREKQRTWDILNDQTR